MKIVTPKEKASELLQKSTDILFERGVRINKGDCVAISLVVVDEIIKASETFMEDVGAVTGIYYQPNFWCLVKEELTKI